MKSHIPIDDRDAWPRIVKFMKDNPQTLMAMISDHTKEKTGTLNKVNVIKKEKYMSSPADWAKRGFLDKNEYLNMEDIQLRKEKPTSKVINENYPPIIVNKEQFYNEKA